MNSIKKVIYIANFWVWLLILPPTAYGQGKTEEYNNQLELANEFYAEGKFEEIQQILSTEVVANMSDKKVALAILAKSYLALEDFEKANELIKQLLFQYRDYEPGTLDPPLYKDHVNELKAVLFSNSVSSVSKKSESLEEAPATIIKITPDQIRQRGYSNLVDVLEDLPGFDISKFYGPEYANIYQRGFRTNNTEKTIILIDGVEENDIWTNWAYISRQYPLSNIESIEVIYGPASTMYGPNAFMGVININTKNASQYLPGNKPVGITGQIGYSPMYNDKLADLTIATRKKDFSFILTGRIFQSDEMDWSTSKGAGNKYFNYDPEDFNTVDYHSIVDRTVSTEDDLIAIRNLLKENPNITSSNYATVVLNNNDTVGLKLTDLGLKKAKELDKANYLNKNVSGNPINFSNQTQTMLFNGKLALGDFTTGFQYWKKKEGGTSQFTDLYMAGSKNGWYWIPEQAYFYTKYDKKITDKLAFSAFANYKIHTVNDETQLTYYSGYATSGLGLKDLANNVNPQWKKTDLFQRSKQFRYETKVLYNPTSKFDLVSGVEYRNSQIQGDYLKLYNDQVDSAAAENNGVFNVGNSQGGNQFNINDFGFYSQGSYLLTKHLKITAGGRLDYNIIRNNLGYGLKFSPRLAAAYSTIAKDLILKLIYSGGIQTVSFWTQYSSIGSRAPNPDLETESIRNYEFTIYKKIHKNLVFDMAFFDAKINNVVGTVTPEGSSIGMNDTIGDFRIFGAQANLKYNWKKLELFGNYTFSEPKQIDSLGFKVDKRVGDISKHQFNIGINYPFAKKFNINLRTNYRGIRKTGVGTTVESNNHQFPALILFNGSFTYQIIRNLSLQINCNNILDKIYAHPGTKAADGATNPKGNAPALDQRRRFFMASIYFDL